MSQTLRLGFIGLGVMGFPMAGHLARAGHRVTVYNRTPAKADAWRARHAGEVAATPADCARDADIVFACVGADDDLRAVTTGPAGAFGAMRPGVERVGPADVRGIPGRRRFGLAGIRRQRAGRAWHWVTGAPRRSGR